MLELLIFFLDFSKMTDSDSTKAIEKLSEVLDLLKAAKKEVKEVKEAKDTKLVEEVKAVEETKPCADKCPLRKAMSEKEFADMVESMKKADVVKLYRTCVDCKECTGCPLMNKKVAFDLPEEVSEVGYEEVAEGPCKKGECIQVINAILSVILLVLFFVFLVRALKGLYCTV